MRNACLTLLAVVLPTFPVRGDEPLHARIDRLVAAGMPEPAAPLATDAEFLRRVSLDLAGTIPTAAEARAFLDDTAPDKRAKLIDRLLASPEHARHLSEVFDVLWMERRRDNRVPSAGWRDFLRESFAANKPFDVLVREVLSADGVDAKARPLAKFYLDRDAEPTLLTRDVSRLFLGRNLTCAQCHDHPNVDEYKQEHFYGVMAFLNRTSLSDPRANTAVLTEKPEGEVSFQSVFDKAKTVRTTKPFLPGRERIKEPEVNGGAAGGPLIYKGQPAFSRRMKLAEEVVESSAFRRTAANRLWAVLLGRGLVHPLEFDHADNPPSHPELLDLLTAEFTANKCDARWLLREIALSQTYQRSSERPAGKELAEDRFAAAMLKPLAPEQFARAAMQATGFTDAERQALGKNLTEAALHGKLAANVTAFVQTFGSRPGEPEGATFQATLDQALFLGNGAAVRGWLVPRAGNLADRLLKAKTAAEVGDELYLAVLTRRPSDEEAKEVADFLAASPDRPAAVGELIWALVASTEFRFNH